MDFKDIINTHTSYTGSRIYDLSFESSCSGVVIDFSEHFKSVLIYAANKYFFVKSKGEDAPIYLVRNLKKSPINENYIRDEWRFIADTGFPVSGEHIMAVVACAENIRIPNNDLRESIIDFASKYIHTDTPIKKHKMYILTEYRANRYIVCSFSTQKEKSTEIPSLKEMAGSKVSYTGGDILKAFESYLENSFDEKDHPDGRVFDYYYYADPYNCYADPYHISEYVYYFVTRIGTTYHLERDILKPISYLDICNEMSRLRNMSISVRGIEIKDTFLSYRDYVISRDDCLYNYVTMFIKDYIESTNPLRDNIYYKLSKPHDGYLITAKRDLLLSPRQEVVIK